MSLTRRNFLRGMLAAAAAPAIVKAENIMRIRPLESGLLVPDSRVIVGRVDVYEDRFDHIIEQLERRTQAVREDLLDALYNISPQETPFVARVLRENSTSWVEDLLT